MDAAEAKAITNEPWYFKQIRRAAVESFNTVLKFTDKQKCIDAKNVLENKHFICSKIKMQSERDGTNWEMIVRWD